MNTPLKNRMIALTSFGLLAIIAAYAVPARAEEKSDAAKFNSSVATLIDCEATLLTSQGRFIQKGDSTHRQNQSKGPQAP